MLVHYDFNKPLQWACDALPFGVGVVLSQIDENGYERPVAFASKTWIAAEKNCVQIEREALALIFGAWKLHRYLYGHVFTSFTDHKPLTSIMDPKSGIPTIAAVCMQGWALILSSWKYNIVYHKSEDNINADVIHVKITLVTVTVKVKMTSFKPFT